jgi:hypothetical protein
VRETFTKFSITKTITIKLLTGFGPRAYFCGPLTVALEVGQADQTKTKIYHLILLFIKMTILRSVSAVLASTEVWLVFAPSIEKYELDYARSRSSFTS